MNPHIKDSLKEFFTKFPFCLATYVCLVGIAYLLFFGWTPVKVDPPTYLTPTPKEEAIIKAISSNGQVYQVSYTGSMKPLLQGGEWVVSAKNYDSIQKGEVLIYQAPYNQSPIIHRAVEKDKLGWIMSGDSAKHTESWFRVTPETYIGTTIAIFKNPQNTP